MVLGRRTGRIVAAQHPEGREQHREDETIAHQVDPEASAIAAFSGFAPQFLIGGDVGETIFMILGFSSDSADLDHSFTPDPQWDSSSLRAGLGFRYTQGSHHLRSFVYWPGWHR